VTTNSCGRWRCSTDTRKCYRKSRWRFQISGQGEAETADFGQSANSLKRCNRYHVNEFRASTLPHRPTQSNSYGMQGVSPPTFPARTHAKTARSCVVFRNFLDSRSYQRQDYLSLIEPIGGAGGYRPLWEGMDALPPLANAWPIVRTIL
jgi:hypothetical protein